MTHHNTPASLESERSLDTPAASAFLCLCEAQITKLRLTGILRAVVHGPKCIRFRVQDLREYRDSLLRGGDGTPAKGRVDAKMGHARSTPSVARAARPAPTTGTRRTAAKTAEAVAEVTGETLANV